MRNAARLVVVTLSLSLPLFAQYGWTPSVGLADNTAWCATGNCLTSIGGVTVETKAGLDGTIYGLNSAGVLFTYTQAAGWVEAASALQKAGGLAIEHISVGSAANVLAQTSGSNNVYILNSAKTAWTLLAGGGTCTDAEIGADGDIWCLASGAIFHWVDGTWVNIAGAATSLSVGDAHNVWVANSAGGLFSFNTSGGWSGASPGFAVSAVMNAIAAGGETSIAAIDTGGKIHVSANSGAAWSTILGTASSIAGGGSMTFVRDSSGVSYHLNLLVPSVSLAAYGSWPCPPSACEEGGNCAPGCVGDNTVSATVKFMGLGGAHGTGGVTAKQTAAPNVYISMLPLEDGANCDPLFSDGYDGTLNAESCTISTGGLAVDNTGGELGSFSAPVSFNVGTSETNYSYATQLAGVCSYNKNCPVGQTATCGVGTVYKAAPCSPQFLEFYYVYFNFGAGNICTPVGPVVGSSVPGNCD